MRITILVLTAFGAIMSSCKHNIKAIQQPVFGGFVLGASKKQYEDQLNVLFKTNQIKVTSNSHMAYFTIENNNIVSQEKLTLFPNFYVSADTIVSKIVLYVYSHELLYASTINQTTDEDLKRGAIEASTNIIQDYYNLLQNFSITSQFDHRYGVQIPTIPEYDAVLNGMVRDSYLKMLTSKYGSPLRTDSVGNEYRTSENFYVDALWKTDLLDIHLVTTKHPSSPRSFYHFISYEYNKETRDKYKLNNSGKDLKNTF